MKKETQTKQILDYLKSGGTLTPLEALNKFGCLRLGARCWDIRNKLGIPIKTERVKTPSGKTVAKYSLIK